MQRRPTMKTIDISLGAAQGAEPGGHDPRSIGHIISQANKLTAEQIERILAHQRETGQRFGEAAVALGVVEKKDVVWALAQQYNYPYRNQADAQKSDELVVANAPFSDQAELFRNLRSQLLIKLGAVQRPLDRTDAAGVCVSVISPRRGDGRSYTAANLALSLAQLGGRVALVDADMRNARLQRLFRIEGRCSGLSEALNGRASPGLYVAIPEFPNLFVLPSGIRPPNPQELVERTTFDSLMRELRSRFSHVIVDTPAAEAGVDGISIASKCGNTLLVARKDHSSLQEVTRLRKLCERASVNFLGSVLNAY